MLKFRGSALRIVASVLVGVMSLSAVPIAALAAEAPTVNAPVVRPPSVKPGAPGREIDPEGWNTSRIRETLFNMYLALQTLAFRTQMIALANDYGGGRAAAVVSSYIFRIADRIGSMLGYEDISMSVIESSFFRLFYNDIGLNRVVSKIGSLALRQIVAYFYNHPEFFD